MDSSKGIPSQVSPDLVVEKLLKCNNCKIASYCGKDCQLADWKHGHKKKCKELSAAQPQPAAAARAQTAEPKPAARGTRTIDWMIYNKAIEDTVRMKEEWRRRMSELALSGHETRGKGMVLVQHSNLDADGIPPLVPDALAGAVFCTMPELRARVSPELYTSLLARDQEAYDRRVSFVLAMSTPHSRDRMHSNAETMAFAPGVGDVPAGPWDPFSVEYRAPYAARPMPKQAQDLIDAVAYAASVADLRKLIDLGGDVGVAIDNMFMWCDGPGCKKVAVTGVAKALPTENVPNLVERLFKCDGCKSKQYCCKACQQADWKRGHKEECKRMSAAS